MAADLAAIEQLHGFTFGNPDDEQPTGRVIATVSCPNPTCTERQMVAVHEGQPLPLHCGRCFTVMLDDPDNPATPAPASPLVLAGADIDLDDLAKRVASILKEG